MERAKRSGWRSIVGGFNLFLGDELKQRWATFLGLLDATLDGGHDLAWLGDAFAVTSECASHVGGVATDCGAAVLLCGHRHHLQLDGHAEVVEQYRQDRDSLADGGLEV